MSRGSRVLRVAVGQISQESNSFAAGATVIDLFRNSYLHEGDDVRRLAESDTEVGGILAACDAAGIGVVPLIATRSVSGPPLSAACYAALKDMLLARLRRAGQVDGVVLSMHGSMLADGEDDPEGDILEEVRGVVGDEVPVVATLDLHGNVTPRMVRHATALVAYRRYPHDDVRATGMRAAELLLRVLRENLTPAMALAKVPMLVSGCEGQTHGDAPMAHLTAAAAALEAKPQILSASCFHVHPYLDVPGLGSGAVVVTDGDGDLAAAAAESIAREFWRRRHAFQPEVHAVAEAVRRGRLVDGGAILLVDAADCAGGGAQGDSVALLRGLLEAGVDEPTLLMVVDPEAAAECVRAGAGADIALAVGHRLDPKWGHPLPIEGRVAQLSDGRFRYVGGAFGGTEASMGPSAVLELGPIRLLVMSRPTYDWADEQFRAVGLDPRAAKFVGVKNPMNYRVAYAGVARAAFVVDTPGPTPADVRHLPYRRTTRPVYPFDDGPADPRTTVVRNDRPFPAA